MSSAWTIELTAAARKNLEKIGHSDAKRIRKFLTERLANAGDPRQSGKALAGKDLDASGVTESETIASFASSRTID